MLLLSRHYILRRESWRLALPQNSPARGVRYALVSFRWASPTGSSITLGLLKLWTLISYTVYESHTRTKTWFHLIRSDPVRFGPWFVISHVINVRFRIQCFVKMFDFHFPSWTSGPLSMWRQLSARGIPKYNMYFDITQHAGVHIFSFKNRPHIFRTLCEILWGR